MKKEYISQESFEELMSDLHRKIEKGKISECNEMLVQILSDTKDHDSYIDRTYIGNLNERKKSSRIENINRMLVGMSLEQIDNVQKYTSDEYDEPNHEAEALEAIMELSRRNNPIKQGEKC